MLSAKAILRKLAVAFYHGVRSLGRYAIFMRDFVHFRALSRSSNNRLPIRWSDRLPCLNDKSSTTPINRHYIFHTAWAARTLNKIHPSKHVDCSSLLYFNVITSAFIPIDFYDFRPAKLDLPGLHSYQADLLDLPFADSSIESLSCLHVLEHIGLGRYGDSLDPAGDLKAISELKRVLADKGHLLIAVPVGSAKVMFNGQRIYSYDQVIDFFNPLRLVESLLIPDNARDGNLVPISDGSLADKQQYGCGCFWFQKGSQ